MGWDEINHSTAKAFLEPGGPGGCARRVPTEVVLIAALRSRPEKGLPLQGVSRTKLLVLVARSPNVPAAFFAAHNHGSAGRVDAVASQQEGSP